MAGSIVFTVLFLAALACTVWLAGKKKTSRTAASLAAQAVAFVEAYFSARAFVGTFGQRLSEALKEGFSEMMNISSDVMVRDEATMRVSAFSVTVILGVVSFILFFFMFFVINMLIIKLLFFRKKKTFVPASDFVRKINPASAVISVISFALISFVILFPLGAASDIAASAAKSCEYKLPASCLTNPISRLYGFAGRPFFDSLTKSAEEFETGDEAQRGAEVYICIRKVTEGKDDGTGAEKIAKSLKSSYLVTDFTSELCANAASSWKNGRRFLNRTVKIPEGRNGELVSDVLEILSGWKRENLIEDIDTAINIYNLLHEHDILKISSGPELMEALSDEEFSVQLFEELSGNGDFIAVIPKVMRFGIGSAADAMELEVNGEYIVEFDAKELSHDDWVYEAKAFSKLLGRMAAISKEGDKLDLPGLLADLYELRDSKIIGNVLLNLLIQFIYNLQLSA